MLERLSPFQAAVLETPEECNLALLGARGGGKSTAAVALIVRHMQEHGANASVLVVRRTLRALSDFEDELLSVAGQLFPSGHSYNRAEKIMRTEGGAKATLAAIERAGDYDKLQGKNFSLIVVEEVTQYPTERVLRLLRSNLRAPEGVPTRVVYLGNPGGPLHGRVFQQHIKDRLDHVPYTLGDEESWITIRSGPADNPFIDQQAYVRKLREACHGDPVRLQQWLFGDWAQGEGLMWPMFTPDTHVLSIEPRNLGQLDLFVPHVGIDWGLSSPSVGHLGLRLRRDGVINGVRIPRDSVIVLDETTDLIGTPGIDEDLNKSSEWPPDRLGERVASVCADWGVRRPNAVVDNARGLQGKDVITMIRETGGFWNVSLPKKGRRAERWAVIGSMLQAALEKSQARPHLYVSDRCPFLIHALGNAVRDERSPDDVADIASCPDHPLDSAAYLINHFRPRRVTSGRTKGFF
ncbi:MAG: phage terminase large subunit [Pseudomonadota bacterium]